MAITNSSLLNPLSITDANPELHLRTFDITRKNTTGNVKFSTVGSITLALHYREEPKNLLSSEAPTIPPIPEMTPAVMSAMWVRLWQILKIFIYLYDMVKFAVSWRIPPLSFVIALGYCCGVFFLDLEYIPLFLCIGVLLLLLVTFVLRKHHLIAKTIQTTEMDSERYYVSKSEYYK